MCTRKPTLATVNRRGKRKEIQEPGAESGNLNVHADGLPSVMPSPATCRHQHTPHLKSSGVGWVMPLRNPQGPTFRERISRPNFITSLSGLSMAPVCQGFWKRGAVPNRDHPRLVTWCEGGADSGGGACGRLLLLLGSVLAAAAAVAEAVMLVALDGGCLPFESGCGLELVLASAVFAVMCLAASVSWSATAVERSKVRAAGAAGALRSIQ